MLRSECWIEIAEASPQTTKPARRCASVVARGPVSAVIVPEPRLHAALKLHPEVRRELFPFSPVLRL